MANYFDQFDPPALAKKKPGGNYFDQFDPAPSADEAEPSLISRAVSAAKDFVGAPVLQGMTLAAKVPAMAIDRAVSGRWFGPGVEAIDEFEKSVGDQKSAEQQRAEQEAQTITKNAGILGQRLVGGGDGAVATFAREVGEGLGSIYSTLRDPRVLLPQAAQQLPMMGASRMAGQAADAIARTGVAVASKAAPAAAAAVAANPAALSIGQRALGQVGTVGAVAGGAALQGADIGSDAYHRLMALPDSQWRAVPGYSELAGEVGPEVAKQRLASDKATVAALQAGAASLISSALPGGASLEGALMRPRGAALPSSPANMVGKAVLGEARQEAIEEGFGAAAANEAVRAVDPKQDRWQGVGAAAAQGGLLGGLMGGGATASVLARDAWARRNDAAPPAPDAPPSAPGAPPSSPLDADEVLGATPASPSAEPDPLTAAPSAPSALPKVRATPGAETEFSTETGARLQAQYALVEAEDLQSSHDESLRPNPAFPPELQPRERDRAASAQQIQGIVGRLDPARLGASADAATGAPIIGDDGLVESGNARTIALKRVYQANGQKAEDYRAFLRANAAQFGLDPAAVDTLRKPVLVRVRTTPVDRAEFARQANASTVAQMSPSEQARADAARIDAMDDLEPTDDGDFATSRDFIRRFMSRLPQTEQSSMMDAGGRLSTTGYARVRNAVLAKAYGNSPVLTRMVESLDDNLRNISRAMMIAAPRVAKARDAIGAGRLHDADLTPHLVGAAEWLSALKDSGTSVDDALAQAGLLGDDAAPETRDMLRFLADNARRPRRIAEFVGAYFDGLEAAGDPGQASLLDETAPPTAAELMSGARRATEEKTNAAVTRNAADPQRGVDRETAPAGERAAGQPADAPGSGSGDQGDGAAGAGAEGSDRVDARGEGAASESVGPEWVDFQESSGTLGIPRAKMPQVKVKVRPHLYAFLESRGITNELQTVDAASLKPTQREYSPRKAEGARTATGEAAVVLVSSDGYVLDGHHRWMSRIANGERVDVRRFSAPIDQLLDAAREFGGTTTSNESEALREKRAEHVERFYDAAADLAAILTKHQRAAMVPEDTPDLMHTLVKLFSEAIQVVGTDMKRATTWVRERLKANPETKKLWNKVSDAMYRKAALQAIEQGTGAGDGGLFSEQAPKAAETVTIDGEAYDLDAPNFGLQVPPRALPDGHPLLAPTSEKAAATVGGVEITRAELQQRIVDSHFADARPAPSDRKPIAYVMGGGGASGKGTILGNLRDDGIVDDAGAVRLDPDEIKKALPEYLRIIGAGDSRAAEVVHEESSGIAKSVQKRAISGRYDIVLDVTLGDPAKGLKTLQGLKDDGYEVRLFGITIDPRVAVVRAMKRAEKSFRYVPIDHLLAAHKGFTPAFERYAEIADQAVLFDNTRGRREIARKSDGQLVFEDRNAYNEAVERSLHVDESAGTLRGITGGRDVVASGGRAWAAERDVGQQALVRDRGRDAGRAGGTAQAEGRLDRGRAGEVRPENLTQGSLFDEPATSDRVGAQGSGAEAPRGAQGDGRVAGVPDRTQRANQLAGRVVGDGAAPGPEVGSAAADGNGGQGQGSGRTRARNRSGRGPAVPAGRDIQPKSGRNYRLTDADLTYAGSWQKKAERNIDAVELLKKLQAEGRQANVEEQRVLAQFNGWGAGDIANNLFGSKPEKARRTIDGYDRVIGQLEALKRGYLRKGGMYRGDYADSGYYEALQLLKDAGKPVGYPEKIDRAMLDQIKPDGVARRWLELHDRLEKALTTAEWAEASRTTQYAHFTSKGIVRSMWAAAERFGFKGGAALEPGAGSGVFPGLMSDALAANTSYTGIEYDSITGGILAQLQPDERILVDGFQNVKLPRDFYDLAIGNPPFSGTKILSDPEYAKQAFALHDYFFAKTMDRVRPGGLVMFVTSRYTMDKLTDKARGYLAERADLVGAIRLPQTAFKQNAGTDVVTDVIFLRKKVPGEQWDGAQPWTKSVPMKVGSRDFPVNEYFHAHPEMVLGTPSDAGSMQNSPEPQYTVEAPEGDIEALFATAVEKMPTDILKPARGSAAEAAQVRELDFNPKAQKEGNYYVSDAGVLMQREEGVGRPVQGKSPKDVEILKAFVPLRDALKQAHYDQLNGGDWEASLKALQAAYKTFTDAHGAVNQSVARLVKSKADELDDDGNPTGRKFDDVEERRTHPLLNVLRDDPDWTLVSALEKVNEETGATSPGAFLTQRVLGGATARPAIATPHDALLTVLNDTGTVDIDLIAERIDMDPADVTEALGSAVYRNPEGSAWETADQYLSGNVKRKLEAATVAAKTDRSFERNVEALKAAQPAPKSPADINVAIGMNWIPGIDYARFLHHIAGIKSRVVFNEATRQWSVQFPDGVSQYDKRATADWGTDRRHAGDILEHALTGRPIRIESKVGTGKDAKNVFDATATEAANAKLEAMREEFSRWVWTDAARSTRLVQAYNDKFNTTVPRSFDGRHLTLPGATSTIDVFDHVKRGAWRIVQSGNTYLAHAVGSGKTFQMVISAMEQKRLGLVKKPMMIVPNHMLQQFAREWQELYPAARLMVADEQGFHTDNRRRWAARVALSDLDGVIMTHSAFKMLDLDPEFKAKIIEEQVEYLRASLEEAEAEDGDGKKKSPRVKQIEKRIENLEEKLKASLSGVGKDRNVRFDELGVDMLYVDEAHGFRKLDYATARQIKGISPQGSEAALDLYIKARWLDDKKPGRSLVMASGTPVTNTMAELYSVQRFMGRAALEERGIEDFDSWAAMFGRERTSLEANASGKYEPVTRFNKFVNVGELTQMFRDFADVVTGDQLAVLLGDKRPKVEGGSRKIIVTPKTKDYAVFQRVLEARYEASRAWKPSKDEPNNPDPVIAIIGDGRLAAIDMRFISPKAPSDPQSKLNRMIDDVIREFKATADMEFHDKKTGAVEPAKGSTMMVFSDLGFGEGVAANRGFSARAWMEKRLRDAGVPMAQVAFMSDFKKSTDKLKLFRDLNAGRVRILVGSSKNMGTGVNAQQRLLNLFHLDSPWFPADLEQREGRIIRQGNKNKQVRIHGYAAKGSYDETMWGMLARKQFFIEQALSGDGSVREIEDVDSVGQYEMAAALVAEDPRILQLAGLRAEAEKLQRLYSAHENQRFRFRDEFRSAQLLVDSLRQVLPEAQAMAGKVADLSGDKFAAKAGRSTYTDRTEWGHALKAQAGKLAANVAPSQDIGSVSGFPVRFVSSKTESAYEWHVELATPMPVALVVRGDESEVGMAVKAANAIADLARAPDRIRERIVQAEASMDAVRGRLETPFPMADMLAGKLREAADLEAQIAADSKDRTWRVERKDTGLGFDVQASSATRAIQKAIETNGGTEEDWRAIESNGQASPDESIDTAWGVMRAEQPDPAGDVVFSRGTGGGMPIAELRRVAGAVSARVPGLPPVKVLQSPADAPQELQAFIKARGATADVEGALHDGTIYLFASGIADAERAEHVLAEHEVAHAGLRALLGDRLKSAMTVIHNENQEVRRLTAPLIKRGMSLAEAVEEVIVDIPSAQLARLKGWRKVAGKVRDALAAHGFARLAAQLDRWLAGHLTEQQRADLFVADLVRQARGYFARRSAGAAPAGTVLAGTRKLSDDLAAQEQWLQAQAEAAGHADIEALLAADYPLFERLAAQWRDEHPAGALLSVSGKVDPYTRAVEAWKAALSRALKAGAPLAAAGTSIDMPMPTVLMAMGVKKSVLSLPVRYLQGIVAKHTDLPAGVLESLPELLSDPLVVFPHVEGGYRAVLDVRTAKGEPIVAGIGSDGRIQTVTPIHNEPGETGDARLAGMLEKELAREGAKVYARKKEALASARAPRGLAIGSFNPNHSASTGAGPAISALLRSPRDKAIVILREKAVKTHGEFGPGIRLSAPAPGAAAAPAAAERAQTLIQSAASTPAPIDALFAGLTRVTGINRATSLIYGLGARLIDRLTPEAVKAGVISDYGVPGAVVDRRALMVGAQRTQLASAGKLLEKLATLTRAESRVAYEWMNMDGSDPRAYVSMMHGLPEESVRVLQDVQKLIDGLSQEAVRLGQLDAEAFKRHRFAYLRRSYFKHVQELNPQETAARAGAIRILGDQYKGRGMVGKAAMRQIQNSAPEWWKRKMVAGKADASLKGEKFERLERRAPSGERTANLPDIGGRRAPGRVLEVHYWPAGEPKPAMYADWDSAGMWEVRDTKGDDLIVWRDFTKDERERMGEIDEARFAIAKTLHGMIHDIEVGKYLEWLAQSQAKATLDGVEGVVVAASERALDVFKPGTWVQVPDAKIPGTSVARYGKLAGRYIPGPVWSDLRQIMGGNRIGPEWYRSLLRAWKSSKTALSPGVHTNNVMSNFVMADWHDVSAGHVAKALRIILGASEGKGAGVLGRVAKGAKSMGLADAEAARAIMERYEASGGAIGGWVTSEIAKEQIAPIVELLQAEVGAAAQAAGAGGVGVYSALQHLLHARFATAWDAFKGSKLAKIAATEGASLIDLYQAEDDVFRLAAWLKAKEEGASDADAGKRARKSFLDYSINAPWVSALRQTALPFVAFTYRAVPMLLETAAKRPHKLIKLMALAGALNALGTLIGGGGDDDERKLLPEEKAGRIWGMVPKLIRMPWNDAHDSPVYLDIRRWIPVGDVLDTGQGHAAMGIPPVLVPGGPLALLGELLANKSQFTGKPITLDTDAWDEKAGKVLDHLYKAFAPNIAILPGTYAWQGVVDAAKGKTDKFGRDMSVPAALSSAMGVKLGAYPADVLRQQVIAKRDAEISEIERNIAGLRRQLRVNGITSEEFEEKQRRQLAKEREVRRKAAEKLATAE